MQFFQNEDELRKQRSGGSWSVSNPSYQQQAPVSLYSSRPGANNYSGKIKKLFPTVSWQCLRSSATTFEQYSLIQIVMHGR